MEKALQTVLKVLKILFKIIILPTKFVFIASAVLGGDYKKGKSWWRQ